MTGVIFFLKTLLVAAMIRTSTLVLFLAHPLECPFLQHAQQLALEVSGISPTSSRNRVPPSATSNRPARSQRSGERPLDVAEEFAFEHPARYCAQLTLIRGRAARAASPVDLPGDAAPCRCPTRPGSAPWRRCVGDQVDLLQRAPDGGAS